MKRISVILIMVLIVLATGIFSLSALGMPTENEATVTPDGDMVIASRFENMLNNNFAYGDEFSSVSDILLASELSLLDKSVDGKLANAELIGFVKDMYGVDADLFADEGKEPIDINGVTEVLPRGYGVYTHKVTKVTENEDGTYTVYSDVISQDHDGNACEYEAISSFVKNDNSRFGYILISSELLELEEVILQSI